MSTRLTPVSVATREVDRWAAKEARLLEELDDARARLTQWELVRATLEAEQAESELELEQEPADVD